MADLALVPRGPLAGRASPAFAALAGEAGVTLVARRDGPQAVLLARRGQAKALAERCSGFGIALPLTPRRIESRGIGVVWTGPEQWLIDWDELETDRAERLFGVFASLCTLVDADDARARFAVRGPCARATLAKMLTIDLHPRVFAAGDAAVTVAGGMSVILWRADEGDAFELAVPRSFAGSFWDWLADSAAEYGVAIER